MHAVLDPVSQPRWPSLASMIEALGLTQAAADRVARAEQQAQAAQAREQQARHSRLKAGFSEVDPFDTRPQPFFPHLAILCQLHGQ